MFEYLRVHEAVVSGDVLIVQLDSRQYAVSGNVLQGVYNKQIPIAKDEVLQLYTPPVKKLVSVIVGDTQYSAEEYYRLNNVDIDEITTLEEEFAHRKLLETLRLGEKVYEETPAVFTPVEIKIVGEVKDTGSKYITTPLVYGKARFSNYDTGFYKLNISELFVDVVKKFSEETGLPLDKPQGNSWKFAKIDGQYFATGTELEKYADQAMRIVNTLDAAKELEDNIRSEIEAYLRGRFNRTVINKTTAAQLFCDLERLRKNVMDLDVKQKSILDQTRAGKSISEMLKKLGEIK